MLAIIAILVIVCLGISEFSIVGSIVFGLVWYMACGAAVLVERPWAGLAIIVTWLPVMAVSSVVSIYRMVRGGG